MDLLPYKPLITKKEFLDNSGYNLETRLKTDDSGNVEQTISNFFMEVAETIFTYLLKYYDFNTTKDIISNESNLEVLKQAQFYQAKYIFENGNIQALTGLGDVPTPIMDLRGDRAYSPTMINLLVRSGIIYGGIG